MSYDPFEHEDVVFFCEDFFNVTLTPMQEKIVRKIAFKHSKRLVISCLTRYGKTFTVAMAVLLFIRFNPKMRINIVAPTSDQAHILRNYITDFIVSCAEFIKLVDLGLTGIETMKKEVSKSRITFRNGCTLKVLSAEGTGNRLMGFGADLVIVDESCLINPEVYRTKINRMLGDNPNSMLVEIGNPSKRDSHMFAHWMSDEFDKIHVDYKIALNEGRISPQFLDEQRRNLTPNEFRILYEAEFPLSENDALINWDWIEDAKKNPAFDDGEDVMGLDCAESGLDYSVLTWCKKKAGKYCVKKVWKWHNADTMKTASDVDEVLRNEKIVPKKIYVDATGVGKGIGDRLNKLGHKVVQVKVGTSPTREPERLLNLKSQLFWRLRTLFEDRNIVLPAQEYRDSVVNELLSMKWEKTASEKIKIVDPEIKSPDFADSLMLACSELNEASFVFVKST